MDRRAALVDRVSRSFEEAFGKLPSLLVAAPGRVNLIGEHTDYNDGFVLPCAIDYETIVAIKPAVGKAIEVVACDLGANDQFTTTEAFANQDEEWKNHVRGIAASFRERGLLLDGAKIAIGGNIPRGAGLSSSASLGVALGKAFAETNQLPDVDETQIALIAQQSENDFVGTACGIMDQIASARSQADHAMLLDCRSLQIFPVRIPDRLSLLIIHSGVKRGLVDSAYNERREQCETAARHYGVRALRDIDRNRLATARGELDDLRYRRARHVVTENERTLKMSEALKIGDIAKVSELMAASHRSMRDDFEITLPAIDQLVELIAARTGDEGGVRMTGGGFGGCVVALLPTVLINDIATLVNENYREPNGNQAKILDCKPVDGVVIL